MKLLFNKNIFKDKSFIKMICFTFVLILVLVLGNCFGFVSADGGGYEYCLNKTDYESSSIYDNNLYSSNEKWYPRDNFSYSLYYDLPSLDFSSISNVDSNFDYSQVKYYMIFSKDGTSISAYFFYAQPTIYFYNGQYLCQMPVGYTDNCVYTCDIPYVVYGEGDGLGHNYHFEITSSCSITEINLGQWRDFYLGNGNSNFLPMYGNNQFLQITNGWNNDFSTIFDAFEHRLDSGNTNYFVNTNYFAGSALPLSGFDNLEGVDYGDIGETSSNNMYLDSCKFTFNFNKYVKSTTDDDLYYKGNWNKGNVVFDAILNDYQIEHLDEFTLHIQWQVLIAGKGFYLQEDALGGFDLGTAVPFGGNYVMNSESTYSLSSFHSNGDSLSWNADTIYNSIYCDNSLLVNYNHSLTSLLAQASEFYEIDWSSFKLYANAWLTTTTESSDKRIDSYNFLSNTSTNVSDSLNTNNNPYIDGETSDFFDQEDSTSVSQTSSSGYGTVTQTVNVNVDNSNSVDSTDSIISKLIDKLLGTTDDDAEYSEAGLTDQFTEATNSNGWIDFFNSTLGFVPNAFWSKLSIMFTTVCAILVVAFILRIILDLL